MLQTHGVHDDRAVTVNGVGHSNPGLGFLQSSPWVLVDPRDLSFTTYCQSDMLLVISGIVVQEMAPLSSKRPART